MDVDAYWFEDDVWQGFLPTESRSALLERHVFQTYVAGLRYFPDARDDPTFVPGSRLTLTPDPDNAWDPNAIAVWNEGSTQQAGHIPAHIAVGLDPRRDRTALVLFEQMESGLRANLGILISREPLTLRRVPDSVERAAWAARAVAKLEAIIAERREPAAEVHRRVLDALDRLQRGGDVRPDELERRLRERLDALGPAPRAELLHVLMLPDFERADRIGEFWSYPESRTFAELLIDCEEDRTLRAMLVGMLGEGQRDLG